MTDQSKIYFSLVFSFLLVFDSNSQHLDRSVYEEKTKEIIQPPGELSCFTKVNVLAFVDYRLYINEKTQQNIMDSAFNCKYAENPSTYVNYRMQDTIGYIDPKDKNFRAYKRFPKNDSIVKKYFKYELASKLNKYFGQKINRATLIASDSIAIIKELTRMKEVFKNTENKNYEMTNTMSDILKKETCDVFVILDVLMYNNKIAVPRTVNTSTIMKIFVFDMRTKKLVFYNYKTAYDHNWIELFSIDNYTSIPSRFKKLLRPLKMYGKKNKRGCS